METKKLLLLIATIAVPGGLLAASAYWAITRCWHRSLSFPHKDSNGAYVVCLECGKSFDYDWSTMKVGGLRACNSIGNPINRATRMELVLDQTKARVSAAFHVIWKGTAAENTLRRRQAERAFRVSKQDKPKVVEANSQSSSTTSEYSSIRASDSGTAKC